MRSIPTAESIPPSLQLTAARLARIVGGLATVVRLRIRSVAREAAPAPPPAHVTALLEQPATRAVLLPGSYAPAARGAALTPATGSPATGSPAARAPAPRPQARVALAASVDSRLGHQRHGSGSSLYSEICALCGATDAAGDRRLVTPCPGRPGVRPG